MGKQKLQKSKTLVLFIYGLLHYLFLPVLSGFLAAGVLAIAGLKQLRIINKFLPFPTIGVDGVTLSTYSGLMLVAAIGCIAGLLLNQFLQFGAKMKHIQIRQSDSPDAMPLPSAAMFVKTLIHLLCIPLLVMLASTVCRRLAEMDMLPGVGIDVKYEVFEVKLTGVVIIASLGCFLMLLFDTGLSIVLRAFRRKDRGLKELK